MGPEEMEKLRIYLSHTIVENPFGAYSLRSKEASAALYQRGDTSDAVVKGQIAAEVLLDTILMSMLWEEGLDPADAALEVFEDSLATRVRKQYARRLGGNWSASGKGPIAAWVWNMARLRGCVVHGNYAPTRDEAKRALTALDGLDSFLRRRLVAKRLQYKRTTLMLLGRPGLERLGGWSGQIVKFMDTEAGNEPDWRLTLKHWRERLNQAR